MPSQASRWRAAAMAAKRQKSFHGISPSKIVARPVTLNKDQNAVLQAVMRGQSVFFTGSAGTGKSFLMKRIIGELYQFFKFNRCPGKIGQDLPCCLGKLLILSPLP